MKKCIVLAFLALNFCLSVPVFCQYIFSVSTIKAGPHPDIAIVYGNVEPSGNTKDVKQVLICKGKDTVTLVFSTYSAILRNWIIDSTNWQEKWSNIEAIDNKIRRTRNQLDIYTGKTDEPAYVLLQAKLKKNIILKDELDALWSSRMLERFKGTVSLQCARTENNQTFTFSYSQAAAIDPMYLQMYASARGMKLNLYFIIATGVLPKIFQEIFAITSYNP